MIITLQCPCSKTSKYFRDIIKLILQGRKWVFYRWKIWGMVTTPRSYIMWVKGKARNRILVLNPGQILYSLDYTDLIALKVCLFGCKMFHVNNKKILKTVIKIAELPNQRLTGQVNFRLLLKAYNVERLRFLLEWLGWIYVLFYATSSLWYRSGT